MAIFSGLTISGGGLTITGASSAPAANDPYFMYNSLLLPGNGTNTAQNNTFLDGSTNNFTITRNGNTTQGSFSPYGGNWSNYLPSAGQTYLFGGSSNLLALGSENFTLEAWFYIQALAPSYSTLFDWRTNGSIVATVPVLTDYNNNGKLTFAYGNGSSTAFIQVVESSTTMPVGSWFHMALVRSGTTVTMYFNGTSVGSATSSQDFGIQNFTIGNPQSANYTPAMYASNVRLVKGTAVYTSAFTPSTTPLTAITNTTLLACQSPRYVDNSINNIALSATTNVSVQRYSPFEPSSLTPSSYSGYFDGNGDYLNAPSNAVFGFGTGDFTIEAWFYFTGTISTYQRPWWFGDDNDNIEINGSVLRVGGASQGTLITGGTTILANTWYHIALTRASGSYTLWLNGSQQGSTASNSYNSSARTFTSMATSGGANPSTGYVSNLRIVKGTAVYTTTFTPSTTPLTAVSGTSLLTCQSSTFIDNSTNNLTLTAAGNTIPSIQNPFGYTSATTEGYTTSTIGGSGYFDGTGDYISVPDNVAFTMGSGDFTIECWVNLSTLTGSQMLIGTCDSAGSQSSMSFVLNVNSGTPRIGVGYGSTVYYATAASSITANTWVHIAGVRNGASVYVYVNGVQSTALDMASLAINDSTQIVAIGRNGNYNGEYVTGYISDVRIVKGTAVYTSNFVPPSSPLTAVTNTSLLTNMTNAGIVDYAMMTTTETVGNAQISTTQSKFGGSSMYFDGTGDYLKSPYNPSYSLPGDFTVETWIYLTSAAGTGNQTIVSFGYNNSTGAGPWGFYLNGTGPYTLYFNSSSGNHGSSTTVDIPINTWTHVTYCRSGSTGRFFVNGTIVGTTISDNFTYSGTTQSLFVGIMSDASSAPLYGYLDDLRITTGYARYTSNFSVPTEAFPTY